MSQENLELWRASIEAEFSFRGTFRNGLMVHSKLYMSQSEALEAVGLEA